MRILLLGAVLARTLVATAAWGAEPEDERKALLEQIDEALESAADSLDDLADASSASGAQASIAQVQRIEGLLDRLSSDTEAQKVVGSYEDHIEDFEEAAKALAALKEGQDDLEDHPGRCEERDEDLIDAVAGFVGARDAAKGLVEIPRLARDARQLAEDVVEEADDHLEEMEDLAEEARAFSESQGAWSALTSALHDAVDEVSEAIEASVEATKTACANLAKGEDHPAVKRGIADLRAFKDSLKDRLIAESDRVLDEAESAWSAQRSTAEQLDRDVEAHLAKSREARSLDTEALEELIVKICGYDIERDGDEAARLADSIASDAVSGARSRKDEITRAYDDLYTRLEAIYDAQLPALQDRLERQAIALTSNGELEQAGEQAEDAAAGASDAIGRIVAEIDRTLGRADGIRRKLDGDLDVFNRVSAGLLAGSNNPRLRAAKDHGIRMHDQLRANSGFECLRDEVTVSGGRADCVSHSRCRVMEFKPNSWSRGATLDDAKKYVSGVNAKFPDQEGQPWTHCWRTTGPTGGRGFIAEEHRYPACD